MPGKKVSKSRLQKEIDEDILNVNCRIAYVGIENCIEALNNIYEHLYEMQTETLSLLSAAKKIKEMFITNFPNVLTYKRPYFD